jgi:hypothetical protein
VQEPSCRECRTIREGLASPARALWDFARIMASPPSALAAPLAFGRPVAGAVRRG